MRGRLEAARLRALADFEVLDTEPEEAFDRLTALAADMFDAPIALVSLIDAERQWFKSRHGLDVPSMPRSLAFCAHAIELDAHATMVVRDASRDPRFSTHASVISEPGIRFYAGAVLTSTDGFNLGTLCVVDTKPRPEPSPQDLRRLTTLANVVIDALELRRANRLAVERQNLLEMAERVSGVGHWRYKVADRSLVWSDEVYRIHGVSRRTFNLDLDSAISFYREEDRSRMGALVMKALQTGQGYEGELQIRSADGLARNVTTKADCTLDQNGQVDALYGIFQDVTEQRQAFDRLREERARYKLLADNVADVIALMSVDGVRSYISPAVEKLLGHTPLEMEGQPAQAFIYEPDRPMFLAALQEMARGVRQKTLQLRAAHKDGHPVWVETRFQLVADEPGAEPEVVAVIRDITERKALETEMARARDVAEEHARRADLAEAVAGLGHWRIDTKTQQVEWSSEMFRIFGLAPDTPLDLPKLMTMIHQDDAKEGTARRARQLAEGGPSENTTSRIFRTDGQLRYLDGTSRAERDASGEIVALVGTLVDVTEQKTAEMALANSEFRFRSLAENAPDIITESRLDGTLTYLSPACLRLTGYRPEELEGRTSFSLMHPDDAVKMKEMCQAALASNGAIAPRTIEFRVRHKAGHEIWLESKPTPVKGDGGDHYVGLTDVIRDISVRKALEAQLRQARAEAESSAAVKGEFLANMSHELRTPLTSIIGFSRLAGEQAELSPLTRDYVDRVGDASRALLCTVNDILDFSKLEAGQVSFEAQPVSLHKLCRATLNLFTPQAGAKDLNLALEGVTEADDLVIAVDPDRIRQILLNFVSNAVKFTETGGVTLRTAYDKAAGDLLVEVIDTGAGVPPEKLNLLFKRFSQIDGSLTRAQSGTGLGLAICKGLVEAMGGEIGVASAAGEGSRFWFRIPAPLATLPGESDEQGGSDQPACSGMRVLVVDDHPANRELARLFLTGVGAEISEAGDGEEAARMAAETPFDVILMDVRMPKLDGPGALRRIRAARGPNEATPILAFTADADAQTASHLTALGFQAVVTKPLEPRPLIDAIERAFAGALPTEASAKEVMPARP